MNRKRFHCKNKKWIFSTPKTKSSIRIITIGNSLVELLKKWNITQHKNRSKYSLYYISNNFICTKENGDFLTPNTLKYISKIVNYELMIPFSFHLLRHTHARMLLEAGANIKDKHCRLATTLDIYSHVTEKMNTATVDIFENIVNPAFSENKKPSDMNLIHAGRM